MPSIAILCLIFGLAVTARADTWTPWETLRDTAADAIDFTWSRECPAESGKECRLAWKFRSRYRKPVKLTWRVVYRTSRGSRELLKETTVSPGESPEYGAVGEGVEQVQVGVPRSEARNAGVVSVVPLPDARAEERIVMAADADDPDIDRQRRGEEYRRRTEEAARRVAGSFREIRELREKCDDLFGTLPVAPPVKGRR